MMQNILKAKSPSKHHTQPQQPDSSEAKDPKQSNFHHNYLQNNNLNTELQFHKIDTTKISCIKNDNNLPKTLYTQKSTTILPSSSTSSSPSSSLSSALLPIVTGATTSLITSSSTTTTSINTTGIINNKPTVPAKPRNIPPINTINNSNNNHHHQKIIANSNNQQQQQQQNFNNKFNNINNKIHISKNLSNIKNRSSLSIDSNNDDINVILTTTSIAVSVTATITTTNNIILEDTTKLTSSLSTLPIAATTISSLSSSSSSLSPSSSKILRNKLKTVSVNFDNTINDDIYHNIYSDKCNKKNNSNHINLLNKNRILLNENEDSTSNIISKNIGITTTTSSSSNNLSNNIGNNLYNNIGTSSSSTTNLGQQQQQNHLKNSNHDDYNFDNVNLNNKKFNNINDINIDIDYKNLKIIDNNSKLFIHNNYNNSNNKQLINDKLNIDNNMDCNITTNPFRSLDIDSKFNNKNSNIFHNNNKNSSISLSSISLSQQPSSASTSGASSSSLLKKSKNNNDTSIQQLAGTSTTTTSSSSIFDQNFYNKISNIYQENSIQSLSSLSPALATTTTENTFLSQESSPPMKTSTISIAPSSLSSSSTSSSSLAAASELINLSKKLYGSTIENDNTTNYKCDYLEYNKESLLLTSLPTTSSITLKPLQLDEKCYEQITNPYNKHIRCNSTSNEITNNTTTDSIKTQLLLSSSSSLLSSSPFNLTDMNKTTITIATTASTLNTTTIQQNLSKINCTTKSPLTKTKMMEFHARIQLLENAMNFRDHTQTITTTAAPVTVTPNQQQQTTINGAATTTIQTSPKKITPQKLNFYQTKKEIEQMLGQRFNLNDHQSYNHNNTVPLSSSSTTVTTTTTTTATGTIGITTKFTNNNQTTKRRLTNLINTSSLDLSKNNSMNTIYNNSNINDNSNIISLTNNTGNNETTNNINNASDEKDHFKNLSKDKISLQNKLQEEMKRQCQKIQEKHSIERYPPQYHYGEIHNSTLNFHSFPESSSKIGQHQLKQIKTSTIGTGRGGATSTSTNKGGTVTTTTTVIDENFLVYRDGILISGPLESLIKHMVPTSNYYPENSFIFAFLLSARLFINPYELLQRICQLCEEQQNIIVKLQQTKAKNSTDNNSLLSSTLASSSSSSTSSSSTSTSGICSGSVGVGSSLNNGRNCINIMNDNCNGINDNNVTGNSSTSTATTATRTSPNNRVNTNIKSKSNNNSNNSNIITNHNTNLRQLQKQQPYNQDNQTDTKTLLKMFAKNFLRLLNEWVNLFPYDFRDERLMQQVRTMQQKCISIDSNLRQDVSIILQNLLEKLTVLETYENFLQSLSNSDATDFTNNMNSGISSSSNNDKDHHYYPHNLTSSNSLVMPVTTIPSSTVTTGAAALTTATTSSSSLSFHHHITGLIPSYTNHSMSSSSIGSMASINGGVEIIEICPSSTVLSQQLTHIELERLSHIGPEEFVQVFAKENINLTENHKSSNTNNIKGASSETPLNADVKKTRNLETYVHWFNRLSYLVATEIVKYSKKKQRVRVVEYWIETARECFNIGNFNSLMAIIAGLNMSPISRLKKTWAKVQSAKFSVLEHQMDPSSNFNSYRSTLKAAMWRSAGATNEREKIIIPFFSLLVKDLYFLNEGCSNRLSNGHINFEKFWQVSKQIKEFISWKEVTCPFERDQKTIMYLQRNPILNENTLAIASFECEPPENQQEKERFKGLKIEILQYNNSNIGLGNNINSGNNSNNPGCSGSNNTNTGNTNNSHINQTIPTTN